MKFQLKALVAALALTAAALPAQAAMTNANSGDSSLILTLLDNTNNISATFDLGFSYSTFSTLASTALANGGTFTWDIASLPNYSAAWTTFLGTANLNISTWAVYAGDNTGNGAGARGIISTLSGGTNWAATTQLTSALANFESYINAFNNPAVSGNHTTVANGAGTAISGAAFAENGAYGTAGRITGTGNVATSLFDTSMTVRQYLTGSAPSVPVNTTTLGNAMGNYTFSMSKAGVLTFAVPVPEADTYAMLVAGLGLVGFAARRRNAK